jgi:hypothetical protein
VRATAAERWSVGRREKMYIELHDGGTVRALSRLPPKFVLSWHGLFGGVLEGYRIYSDDGQVLSLSLAGPTPRNTALTRLLANTIYNPFRSFDVRYQPHGTFALSDLKEQILTLLSRDDDILSQFLSEQEIRSSVQAANTFQQLWQVVSSVQSA